MSWCLHAHVLLLNYAYSYFLCILNWHLKSQWLTAKIRLELNTTFLCKHDDVNAWFRFLHQQHIEAKTKWSPFSRRHLQMDFLEWKLISIKISLQFVPRGPSNIGSDNGLAPTRWHAIIWANDDYFTDAYMRHSASVSWGNTLVIVGLPSQRPAR